MDGYGEREGVPGWVVPAAAISSMATVVLAVLFYTHITSPHGVSTFSSITIVDSSGTTWAVLGADAEGPSLNLFDKSGDIRISMAVVNGRPVLELIDSQGNPRITAEIAEGDYAQIFLSDRDGRYRLQVAESDSVAALSIYDGEGVRQLYAGVEDSTSACISIAEPGGTQNVALGWYGEGFWGPTLSLSGYPASHAYLQAGCSSIPGLGGWITRPVNSIQLFDASGALVWSVP